MEKRKPDFLEVKSMCCKQKTEVWKHAMGTKISWNSNGRSQRRHCTHLGIWALPILNFLNHHITKTLTILSH